MLSVTDDTTPEKQHRHIIHGQTSPEIPQEGILQQALSRCQEHVDAADSEDRIRLNAIKFHLLEQATWIFHVEECIKRYNAQTKGVENFNKLRDSAVCINYRALVNPPYVG